MLINVPTDRNRPVAVHPSTLPLPVVGSEALRSPHAAADKVLVNCGSRSHGPDCGAMTTVKYRYSDFFTIF